MKKYEFDASLVLRSFDCEDTKLKMRSQVFRGFFFGQFYINNTRCHSDKRSEEESREHPLYTVENFRSG